MPRTRNATPSRETLADVVANLEADIVRNRLQAEDDGYNGYAGSAAGAQANYDSELVRRLRATVEYAESAAKRERERQERAAAEPSFANLIRRYRARAEELKRDIRNIDLDGNSSRHEREELAALIVTIGEIEAALRHNHQQGRGTL